jgi:hypothetical protein
LISVLLHNLFKSMNIQNLTNIQQVSDLFTGNTAHVMRKK